VATYFNEGDRRIGMRVRLIEEDRKSLEDLAGLIVNPGSPSPVRLADIVPGGKLEVTEGPSEIRRINQQRAGVVAANTSGIDLGNVTAGVRAALGRVDAPPNFLVGFGGQKEEMDASLRSLLNALILAMFLVYVVMAMQFESFLQPLVIILAVPLAMVGVGPVLWVLGSPVNILVFIGMIVLAGIVVNNAIVLIDHVNQGRSTGLDLVEALVDAGKTRLRPILLTTLTTVLGLVPLTGIGSGIPVLEWVFGSGEGVEVRAPLALTVIGGLSASTVLTLIVVPVVYSFLPGGGRRGGGEAAAT
jgi:multidrug efflux pump subunit AcrB